MKIDEYRKPLLEISLPLDVWVSARTKKTLNLNTYTRTDKYTLNKMKKKYEEVVRGIMIEAKWKTVTVPVRLEYKYWHGSKRHVDLENPCSIISKFVCDGLTAVGFWRDDSNRYVKATSYEFMGVDAKNPRCELSVFPYR